MRILSMLAGFAGSVLASTVVVAQTGNSGPAVAPGSTSFNAAEFIGRRSPGMLRASDFVGRDIYGPDNQVIGEVADVLFGPEGRISGLVLEVGGFLGVGERQVGVPIHAVRIVPGATATTGTTGGLPPSTATGAETRDSNRISPVVYPEKIILPVPLDSIRAAPPFEDDRPGMRRQP